MSENDNELQVLRKPFPENQISKLPKPTISNDEWKKLPKSKCKECGGYHATTSTIHLDYVGHAALTDRLLDTDIGWSWEPMALKDGLPAFDTSGGLWIRLTVCGITRIGYGNAATASFRTVGNREKEVIGDALRNAAMRFGAALDLWHKGDLHTEDIETATTKPPEPKESKSDPSSQAVEGKKELSKLRKALEAKISEEKIDRDMFKEYLASVKWITAVDGRLSMNTLKDENIPKLLDNWLTMYAKFSGWVDKRNVT